MPNGTTTSMSFLILCKCSLMMCGVARVPASRSPRAPRLILQNPVMGRDTGSLYTQIYDVKLSILILLIHFFHKHDSLSENLHRSGTVGFVLHGRGPARLDAVGSEHANPASGR